MLPSISAINRIVVRLVYRDAVEACGNSIANGLIWTLVSTTLSSMETAQPGNRATSVE